MYLYRSKADCIGPKMKRWRCGTDFLFAMLHATRKLNAAILHRFLKTSGTKNTTTCSSFSKWVNHEGQTRQTPESNDIVTLECSPWWLASLSSQQGLELSHGHRPIPPSPKTRWRFEAGSMFVDWILQV